MTKKNTIVQTKHPQKHANKMSSGLNNNLLQTLSFRASRFQQPVQILQGQGCNSGIALDRMAYTRNPPILARIRWGFPMTYSPKNRIYHLDSTIPRDYESTPLFVSAGTASQQPTPTAEQTLANT